LTGFIYFVLSIFNNHSLNSPDKSICSSLLYVIIQNVGGYIFYLTLVFFRNNIEWKKVEESGGKVPAFSGKYYYNVDLKGRIIIPAPFREIISTNYSPKLYITNAPFDKCLYIFPMEEWNRLQELVRTKPRFDEAIRFFLRRVVASAVETEMDKQGRVLIPAALREDANINTNVVLAGQIERVELWDRNEWDNLFDPSRIDRKSIEEKLAAFGL
jgi:MraZ protein